MSWPTTRRRAAAARLNSIAVSRPGGSAGGFGGNRRIKVVLRVSGAKAPLLSAAGVRVGTAAIDAAAGRLVALAGLGRPETTGIARNVRLGKETNAAAASDPSEQTRSGVIVVIAVGGVIVVIAVTARGVSEATSRAAPVVDPAVERRIGTIAADSPENGKTLMDKASPGVPAVVD